VIVGSLLAFQDGVVVIPEGDGVERWSMHCPVVHLSDTPNPGSLKVGDHALDLLRILLVNYKYC
jgi:hypothetical protein